MALNLIKKIHQVRDRPLLRTVFKILTPLGFGLMGGHSVSCNPNIVQICKSRMKILDNPLLLPLVFAIMCEWFNNDPFDCLTCSHFLNKWKGIQYTHKPIW